LKRLARPRFVSQVARVTDSLQMARNLFPGKSNSLDALCRRLEVDNTGRTLHGALLDAGLLAEVYLRMTRGRTRWSSKPRKATRGGRRAADRSDHVHAGRGRCPCGRTGGARCLAGDLDKVSGGKTLWRRLA